MQFQKHLPKTPPPPRKTVISLNEMRIDLSTALNKPTEERKANQNKNS